MSISFLVCIAIAIAFAIWLKSVGVKRARNGEFCGVCLGIARHFELNPSAVRILWILWTLCLGGGVITYIILWAVLPEE